MPTPKALRRQFLLDPEVVFLNHGSYGACPRPVFAVYQRWQRELERQPVEFLGRRVRGLLADARAALAGYVGARADDLVFLPNATAGVNVAAAAIPLRPGDEVVATDLEYGACDLVWETVCARAAASYVRAPMPLPLREAADVVDALFAATGERTRAIFVSHLTSKTALRLPVEAICARARTEGILVVVDGAHAPGHVPLDLQSLGADFYAGNCHKWLCAPKGAGFLWVRPELHQTVGALSIGWGFRAGSSFLDRNEEQGTRDPAAALTVPAAIEWQAEQGWDEVRARCRALALEARDELAELTGLEPLTSDPERFLGQMVAAPLAGGDAEAIHRRLYDEHRIEVPVQDRSGQPWIRVSFQGYNDASDLERLLAALAEL